MNEDCPCDPCEDPRNPTLGSPQRENSGSPLGNEPAIQQVQLVGIKGVDANGNPIIVPVQVTSDGSLKIQLNELPRGLTGTATRASGTVETYVNGRLQTFTGVGSGGDTFVNA